jgi:hypothetical protein
MEGTAMAIKRKKSGYRNAQMNLRDILYAELGVTLSNERIADLVHGERLLALANSIPGTKERDDIVSAIVLEVSNNLE